MIRKLTLLLISCVLSSCNGFLSSKKTKNIVDLTPKLAIEENRTMILGTHAMKDASISKLEKNKAKFITLAKRAIISEPCLVSGIAYSVDSQGTITAVDLGSQKTLWSSNPASKVTSEEYMGGGIISSNNRLYITNGSRFLIILDSTTGYEILRKEFPDIIRAAPVLAADNILIQTISNQTFAYNIASSRIAWQHEGMFEVLASNYHTNPIIYKDHVIVSYSSGQLMKLNSRDGKEQWQQNLFRSDEVSLPSLDSVTVSCPPVVHDEYLYIASSTNKLFKIDLATGIVLWVAKANDVQSMSISGNNLFLTNNARQVASLDIKTGKVTWVAELDQQQNNKKIKAASIFSPFFTKEDNVEYLNVITGNGNIYLFLVEQGTIATTPTIVKLKKNINHVWFVGNESLYLITDKKLMVIK